MALLNVNRENTDAFYRYKMPALIAKVEGKGNGIKTVVVNMPDVAKALQRPPSCKMMLGMYIHIVSSICSCVNLAFMEFARCTRHNRSIEVAFTRGCDDVYNASCVHSRPYSACASLVILLRSLQVLWV